MLCKELVWGRLCLVDVYVVISVMLAFFFWRCSFFCVAIFFALQFFCVTVVFVLVEFLRQ